MDKIEQGFQRRCFARAIAPDKPCNRTGQDLKRHVFSAKLSYCLHRPFTDNCVAILFLLFFRWFRRTRLGIKNRFRKVLKRAVVDDSDALVDITKQQQCVAGFDIEYLPCFLWNYNLPLSPTLAVHAYFP